MTKPNIILVVFDDITIEQLQRMPQLMKLANTGVSFSNCISVTPLCQPARMTLLSGQMSHNHHAYDNTGVPLSSFDHPTLIPKQVQVAGYKTCHIGKYTNSGLVTEPIPEGWDDWHAISPQKYFGYSINDNGVTTVKGSTINDYYTTVCRDRALAFIASTTQPFFMQLCFKAPHFDQPSADWLNTTPSPEYAGVVGTKQAPRNPNFNVNMGTPPAYMAHADMDGAKIARVDNFYSRSTEVLISADNALRSISAALVAAGKTNTVVIATADHGYMRGEGKDPAGKNVPYLPSMRVPCTISGPVEFVAQNKTCTELVNQADIAATIVALSGATPLRTLDGAPLTGLMLNPLAGALRNYLLLEWLPPIEATGGATGWFVPIPVYRGLMSKRYLYVVYSTGEEELYDLVDDPHQLQNIVALNRGVASSMAAITSRSANCVGAACMLM